MRIQRAPAAAPANVTITRLEFGAAGTDGDPVVESIANVAFAPDVDRLFWAKGGSLYSSDPEGFDVSLAHESNATRLILGLAYDTSPNGPSLYYTDLVDRSIWVLQNPTSPSTRSSSRVLTGPTGTIYHVAVDGWRGEHLYFTERLVEPLTFIRRCDLDGSNVVSLVQARGSPNGIAVDPDGGFLYWSDSSGEGAIMQATLMGMAPSTLVTPAPGVTSLFLDLGQRILYWVEPRLSSGMIRAQGLDASGDVIGTPSTAVVVGSYVPLGVTTSGFQASPSATPSPSPSTSASATHTPSPTSLLSTSPTPTQTPSATPSPSAQAKNVEILSAPADDEVKAVIITWFVNATIAADAESYTIFVRPGNFTVTVDPETTSYTVEGLDPGQTYEIEVVVNFPDETTEPVDDVLLEPITDDGLLSFTWVAAGVVIVLSLLVCGGLWFSHCRK